MPIHVRVARPHRVTESGRPLRRTALVARTIARTEVAFRARGEGVVSPYSPPKGFQPDPYVDYCRILTDEGGILITYKDIDERLRHTVWRLFAWTVATGGEAVFLYSYSPLHNFWINLVCFGIAAVINWLIIRKPVEIYRTIEIRPDCLILEGADIFWTRNMGDQPAFRQDDEGSQILSGIYGTRFVEYLTVRRFDENDRTSEVLTMHLQDAMRQLWAMPYA